MHDYQHNGASWQNPLPEVLRVQKGVVVCSGKAVPECACLQQKAGGEEEEA